MGWHLAGSFVINGSRETKSYCKWKQRNREVPGEESKDRGEVSFSNGETTHVWRLVAMSQLREKGGGWRGGEPCWRDVLVLGRREGIKCPDCIVSKLTRKEGLREGKSPFILEVRLGVT